MSRRSLLLAALTAPVAVAAPPAADMLLVGDSLAYQFGPRLAPAIKPKGKRLALDGRGATSARQWLKLGWFRAALKRHSSPLVLISLGVNCISSERASLPDVVAGLIELAEGRRVLWLLPPPIWYSTDYLTHAVSVNQVEAFAPGKLQMEKRLNDKGQWVDDVHPTDLGYREWAKLLVNYLGSTQ